MSLVKKLFSCLAHLSVFKVAMNKNRCQHLCLSIKLKRMKYFLEFFSSCDVFNKKPDVETSGRKPKLTAHEKIDSCLIVIINMKLQKYKAFESWQT